MPEIFTIPANSRVPVGFPARYLFIENISVPGAEIEIEGYGDLGGERFSFAETLTEGASLSGFPITINDWYFKNKSGVDLTVTIKAGLVYYQKNEFSGVVSGDVNAVITESVDIVTKEKNKTLDDTEFVGTAHATAATSSYGCNALLNPAASGVDLHISQCGLVSTTAAQLSYITEAALLALGGIVDFTAAMYDTAGGHGKNAQSVFSEGKIYQGNNPATFPIFAREVCSSFIQQKMFSEGSPYVVKPGYALLIRSDAVNQPMSSRFEWSEVPTV